MRFNHHPFLLVLIVLLAAVQARGEEAANDLFPMGINAGKSQPLTNGRSPRPISKIAENVTVVTAAEIARLNAHSLADVLQTVPGLYVQNTRTPGDFTFFKIQGQDDAYATIMLLVDGINQGTLLQGMIDPGLFPVQQIERIEIIKGAASAAWGPALAGVVNVVTKTPEAGRLYSGGVSASLGERGTRDLTAELSGSKGGFGYYLTGGNLHSAGLLPNNAVNRKSLYTKLTYDLPSKGNLTFGFANLEVQRGLVEVYDVDYDYTEHDNASAHRYQTFLTFTYPLQPDLALELSGYDSRFNGGTIWGHVDPPRLIVADNNYIFENRNRGAKAKLTWGDNRRNLVTGIEYLHSSITNIDMLHPDWGILNDRVRDSVAVYANATYSFMNLTLLPGVRYDRTGLDENTTNYTFGITYRLGSATLLRGYWATGYGMPNALLKSVPAKVRTLQAGIESDAIPYLWLKGSYFYNHIWQIQDYFNDPTIFYTNDVQGAELEARTVRIAGLSFRGGYTFTDARDKGTGKKIKGVPVHLAKLAFSYVDAARGNDLLLSGNYAWLNVEDWHRGHYRPIIWDLHLTQKILPGNERSPELFLNLNNIFNGSQYWDYWYKNASRWIEGGVRFRF